MPMTVIIARDVLPKFHGFLASCMTELSTGVYVHPRMSARVRETITHILEKWQSRQKSGSVTVVWNDKNRADGLGVTVIGRPDRYVIDCDGVPLICRIEKE